MKSTLLPSTPPPPTPAKGQQWLHSASKVPEGCVWSSHLSSPALPFGESRIPEGPCFRVLGMVIQKPWKSAETSIGGTSKALKRNFYHLPLFHKANLRFWETDKFSLLYIVREKMYKFQSLNSPKRIFFPLPLCFLSPWDLLHRLLTKP